MNIARQFTHNCSTIFPKHTHFSFMVSGNLGKNYNLMLLCWKEMLSTFQEQTLKKHFLYFYIQIKLKTIKWCLHYSLSILSKWVKFVWNLLFFCPTLSFDYKKQAIHFFFFCLFDLSILWWRVVKKGAHNVWL